MRSTLLAATVCASVVAVGCGSSSRTKTATKTAKRPATTAASPRERAALAADAFIGLPGDRAFRVTYKSVGRYETASLPAFVAHGLSRLSLFASGVAVVQADGDLRMSIRPYSGAPYRMSALGGRGSTSTNGAPPRPTSLRRVNEALNAYFYTPMELVGQGESLRYGGREVVRGVRVEEFRTTLSGRETDEVFPPTPHVPSREGPTKLKLLVASRDGSPVPIQASAVLTFRFSLPYDGRTLHVPVRQQMTWSYSRIVQ